MARGRCGVQADEFAAARGLPCGDPPLRDAAPFYRQVARSRDIILASGGLMRFCDSFTILYQVGIQEIITPWSLRCVLVALKPRQKIAQDWDLRARFPAKASFSLLGAGHQGQDQADFVFGSENVPPKAFVLELTGIPQPYLVHLAPPLRLNRVLLKTCCIRILQLLVSDWRRWSAGPPEPV